MTKMAPRGPALKPWHGAAILQCLRRCTKIYTDSLRPVVHLSCVLPAYVAHTVCLSACVCHALRQLGDAISPHTPLVVHVIDAQSCETGEGASCTVFETSKQQKKFLFAQMTLLVIEQQKGRQAVLNLRAIIEHSTKIPLPPAGKPKKRCSEAAPACRTLEQTEIWDSSFWVLAPSQNDLEFSICRRSIVTWACRLLVAWSGVLEPKLHPKYLWDQAESVEYPDTDPQRDCLDWHAQQVWRTNSVMKSSGHIFWRLAVFCYVFSYLSSSRGERR